MDRRCARIGPVVRIGLSSHWIQDFSTEGHREMIKSLLIATLVGLIVAPGAANANSHNRLKSTDWDKVRHHQRVIALAIGKREEARKKLINVRTMTDAMQGLAKNAPDKLQKDWALGAAANLDKLRKQYRDEMFSFDKVAKDQQGIVCSLYSKRDFPKDRECVKRRSGPASPSIEYGPNLHGG